MRLTSPRLTSPRVSPVSLEEYRRINQELFATEAREGRGDVLNLTRTWARNPALMKAQRPLQLHLNAHTTLGKREHELVVLRIGWLCQSEYEFAQHTGRAGLTPEEMRRIIAGPDAPGWTEFEAALLRAVDELYRDHIVSDASWAKLAERYSVEQLMDMVSLTGRYWTVSVMLNTLGVQLEEGKSGFRRSPPSA